MIGGVVSEVCPCIVDKIGLDRKNDDTMVINKEVKHSVTKWKTHNLMDLFLSNHHVIERWKLIKDFLFLRKSA
jgi:hypothetical protein